MQAETIAIGSELVLGELVDTNSAHIARELRTLGLPVKLMSAVGDEEPLIVAQLQQAMARSTVIFTTGGLGPTEDDKTRQAVATATGRPLVFQPALLAQIEARFARFGRKMAENNHQQAYVPDGAIAIENPVGTAPVFIVDEGECVIVSLPGVPREMKHLLETEIKPWLRQRFNLTGVVKVRTLHVAGMGESDLDVIVRDLEQSQNPEVGLSAHIGVIDIRITARAETEAEADALIAGIETQARERVGERIFGVDGETLAGVALAGLAARGETVASIEAGTDGKLMSELTRADAGQERYVQGRLLPPLHVPLAKEQMVQLALDMARNHNADYGLACLVAEFEGGYEIGTVIAHAPTGQHKAHVRSYQGYVAYARDWSVHACLDLLRVWRPGVD